jgi:hypothetical protein
MPGGSKRSAIDPRAAALAATSQRIAISEAIEDYRRAWRRLRRWARRMEFVLCAGTATES